jgi:competence protein ComFC
MLYLDKVIVLTHYRNTAIKTLLKDAKYYKKTAILEDFSNYLAPILYENLSFVERENMIIIPAPMHFFREIKRGYNHTEILARYISKELFITLDNALIKKVKNTKQQSKLTSTQRNKNLHSSFRINKKKIQSL